MDARSIEQARSPLRIGLMMRGVDEVDGPGVLCRERCRALLQIDAVNRYFLLYRSPRQVGAFSGHENASEVVVRAPGKLLWDQVAVPIAARRLRLDLLFHHKFSIPLWSPCATVVEQQGFEYWTHPHWYDAFDLFYARHAIPIYCRRATRIVTISETLCEALAQYAGVPRDQMRALGAAASSAFAPITDPVRLDEVRRRYGLPASPYFLMVIKGYSRAGRSGELYHGKNPLGVLRAYARLPQEITERFPIVVVGPGVDRAVLLRELGASAPAAERFCVTGFVAHEDMPAVYSLARALVFPSFAESFGLPIVEAMACDCPVITSIVGACAEVAGEGALLVDPASVPAIADAMQLIAEHEDLAMDLRARGRERAKRYSWETSARILLEEFEAAVRRG